MSSGFVAYGARYRSLDLWRGFAALWVLVFHGFNVWLEAQPDLLPRWLGGFIHHGWLGVHVFFVVSGYCITERIVREHAAGGAGLGFMADRMLRLYPPYWATLLLVGVISIAGALAKGQAVAHPGTLPVGNEWFLTIFTVEPWFARPSYLLVAWSLAFEIGFYLLAAAGLALARWARRPWVGFAWGAVWGAIGLLPGVGDWVPLLAFWPHFALGGIVWLLLHRVGSAPRRLALGILLFGAICAAGWSQPAGLRFQLQFACGCALLLLALRPWDDRLANFPGLRWLGWVGTFSYSLYLIHAPIIGRARNLLGRWWTPDDPWARWILFACCLLTVAAAWLFYRLIELRSEAYRKSLRPRPCPPVV